MKAFIGRPVLHLATLMAALAATGCGGGEVGLCFFPEQEEVEELTQEECAERGGTWQAAEQSVVGV
jgi:putative hemolysin